MDSQTNTLTRIGVGGQLNWLIGGALGGLGGAAIFGALLWLIDPTIVSEAIPTVYGFESGGPTGWAFHLANGSFLGIVFAFLVTREPILGTLTADVETPLLDSIDPNGRIILSGIVYGILVWVLIPGVLFSILMTVYEISTILPWGSVFSLVGHLLYGALLGALVSVFIDLEREVSQADAPFEEASDPPAEQSE